MSLLSKPLFKVEYKRSIKGNLIWSVALGISLFAIVAIYPLFKDMMQSLLDFMAALEETNSPLIDMMNDFGGIPENAMEYFATEGAMILQIVGGIYAAIIGFGIINRDEKENTIEVLYTLPISRVEMLSAKILSVVLNLFTFTVIAFGLASLGFILIQETEGMTQFFLFGALNFLMFLIVSILGLGLAIILKPNQSSMLAVVIPFPLYIISVIAQATNISAIKNLKYLTPFTFADPIGFLKTNADFQWLNMVIFITISLLIITICFIRFNKREFI